VLIPGFPPEIPHISSGKNALLTLLTSGEGHHVPPLGTSRNRHVPRGPLGCRLDPCSFSICETPALHPSGSSLQKSNRRDPRRCHASNPNNTSIHLRRDPCSSLLQETTVFASNMFINPNAQNHPSTPPPMSQRKLSPAVVRIIRPAWLTGRSDRNSRCRAAALAQQQILHVWCTNHPHQSPWRTSLISAAPNPSEPWSAPAPRDTARLLALEFLPVFLPPARHLDFSLLLGTRGRSSRAAAPLTLRVHIGRALYMILPRTSFAHRSGLLVPDGSAAPRARVHVRAARRRDVLGPARTARSSSG